MSSKTQIFVNLPVKNLDNSIEFFNKLGFSFNPNYTDEKAACLIISEEIYAMLILEPVFKSFTKKEIADTKNCSEFIMCLSADSREKVDEIVNKAVKAGSKVTTDPVDQGFMYEWGFEDLDGHLWTYFYMNKNDANAD